MDFTFTRDYRSSMDDFNFVGTLVEKMPESKEEKHEKVKRLSKRGETLNKRHEKLYDILNTILNSSFRYFNKERIRKANELLDKTEKEIQYNVLERFFLENYLAKIERY